MCNTNPYLTAHISSSIMEHKQKKHVCLSYSSSLLKIENVSPEKIPLLELYIKFH